MDAVFDSVKKSMKKKLRLHHLIFIILAVICLYLFGIFIIYLQEKDVSPEVTYFDELENSVIVVMGEYPDKPRSITARILHLILLAFGVLLFGTVVAKISSVFVTHALNTRRKMKKFKDHIIVCNWNDNAENVIRQLIDSNLGSGLDIVVMSPEPVEDEGFIEDFDNVYFAQRDPTQHSALLELNAHHARCVILMADLKCPSPDDKNALIALAVKHLEEDKKIDVHVVAELVNMDRKRHLLEAGVDEVVCSMGFTAGVIAQSALFKKMSEVYERLLSYSGETNEIYFIPPGKYPADFIGKDFQTLNKMVNERRPANDENPFLLLGVKQDEQIKLNPKKENFDGLEKDDSLIVMAFSHVEQI